MHLALGAPLTWCAPCGTGIYKNEAHFYNDFTVEGGGLPRPECYHVSADLAAAAPKFCFIIENAVLSRATHTVHSHTVHLPH